MDLPLADGSPQPAVITAGDLRYGRECEYALLVTADVRLGLREPVPAVVDPVRDRFGDLGREYEREVTDELTEQVGGEAGDGVVDARRLDAAGVLAVLDDPATRLVHQAAVRGDRFSGRADHLLRDDAGWVVAETKLARSPRPHALLQAAAYADALAGSGVRVASFVRLILGDGTHHDAPRDELAEELAEVRSRLLEVLDTHVAEGAPVTWGDPRWRACLRCDACRAELAAREDVGLVAGVRTATRRALLEAGVTTMTELAGRTAPVEGIDDTALTALRSQARLQLTEPTPEDPLPYEVHDPAALAALPPPSEGDVFFDFEGDPLWRGTTPTDQGLEYLFGSLTATGEFVPFWAHDREQERAALIGFVGWLRERLERWPDLHVFHYSPYERTALTRLAARHDVLREDVAQILDSGVFVDLYAVVKAGVRVGSSSYSIKRLEPLYMGDELRDADGVTAGGDSIIEYQRYREAVAAGNATEAAARLEDLRQYNEYDCRSTLRLRDWLLAHADAQAPQVTAAS
ncbi:TM0106 family RecB-like putative nuclease [Janibacter anophelis]|uniref:TM0106 family RecB-like putative nuclease n=1 Tax=Janibacter anophelis TaxID=319054 RepID=UPI0012EDC364|nr:TM0106 family RecB-like putative nuclease [Janibacter anophelis]